MKNLSRLGQLLRRFCCRYLNYFPHLTLPRKMFISSLTTSPEILLQPLPPYKYFISLLKNILQRDEDRPFVLLLHCDQSHLSTLDSRHPQHGPSLVHVQVSRRPTDAVAEDTHVLIKSDKEDNISACSDKEENFYFSIILSMQHLSDSLLLNSL